MRIRAALVAFIFFVAIVALLLGLCEGLSNNKWTIMGFVFDYIPTGSNIDDLKQQVCIRASNDWIGTILNVVAPSCCRL